MSATSQTTPTPPVDFYDAGPVPGRRRFVENVADEVAAVFEPALGRQPTDDERMAVAQVLWRAFVAESAES